MRLNRILVVDDSDADQFFARLVIGEFDPTIEVFEAFDGQQALEWLAAASAPPDLVFLDINMPGIDGHEFLRRYSQAGKPPSVIVMLSSSREQRDIDEAGKYDIVAEYLVKPLRTQDLEKLATL